MKISLIAAIANNRVIGVNGKMPWHLSADLKRFKQITLGSAVLMGRKTYEAIGKPLPGRENIIITKNVNYQQSQCLIFNDIASALNYCSKYTEVFVIGGATLYQAILPMADYLFLTVINKNFAGDTFFPEIDSQNWLELENQTIDNDASVDFSYSFIKLEQISKRGK